MGTDTLHSFWERSLAELAKVEMKAVVEEVTPTDRMLTTYDVTLSSFEGRRIQAWYTIPSGNHKQEPPADGWPAVMGFPGYSGMLPPMTHLARFGYAALALHPRGQGESAREWKLDGPSKITSHLESPEKYYYRGAYLDCVRGIDFLVSRPEIDSRRIGVWGASQGGGLTLATAALDNRVAAACAQVPWLCNFPVAAEVTAEPYIELHDYLAKHPPERKTALETLAYFDTLNLADRIECPLLMCTAIMDEVHPYRTNMPVFENIKTVKSVIVYQDLQHGYGGDFSRHALDWLDRYLLR